MTNNSKEHEKKNKKRNAAVRKYYRNHPEVAAENRRNWRKKNPERDYYLNSKSQAKNFILNYATDKKNFLKLLGGCAKMREIAVGNSPVKLVW